MGSFQHAGGGHFPALWFLLALALILPGALIRAETFEPVQSDAASRRVINFAGRDWWVKNGLNMGPGPNNFSNSEESVWVDDAGKLHLKIRQIDGVWHCAEVWTLEPAAYGNYLFWLESRVDLYDPNIVASPFLYADDLSEIDIEFSRWGDPGYPCGSYTVQPYSIEGNNHPFEVSLEGSWTSHSFLWQPDYVRFRSLHGHYEEPPQEGFVIEDWLYEGDSIPAESDDMLLHINLWLMSGLPPTNAQEAELIVSNVFVTPGIFIEPPELHLEQISGSQVRLSWDPVPNALSYEVYHADTPLPVSAPGWTALSSTPATFLELQSTDDRKFYYIKAIRD